MITAFVLLIFLSGLAAAYFFVAYNELRRLAENVRSRQADIYASVKKRLDIAQRLSDIAIGYGDDEKLTHMAVVGADLDQANNVDAVSRVIGNVQMLANRFPELKASDTYQHLMNQLDQIENLILERREKYNIAAETYNSKRGSLPHLFYSERIGFAEAPYFSLDNEGEVSSFSFTTDDGRKLRESMLGVALKASAQAQTTREKIKGAVNTAILSKSSEEAKPKQSEDDNNNH